MPHTFPFAPILEEAFTDEQAAAIARRSLSWIRSNRSAGALLVADLDGRRGVDAASLFRLMEARRPRNAKRSRQQLRAVVDNSAALPVRRERVAPTWRYRVVTGGKAAQPIT